MEAARIMAAVVVAEVSLSQPEKLSQLEALHTTLQLEVVVWRQATLEVH